MIDEQEEERVVSRVFPNQAFGFLKVTVERPLRLNFQADTERIARLDAQTAFRNLAVSRKRKHAAEIEREKAAGRDQQAAIRSLLNGLDADKCYMDRAEFDNDVTRPAKASEALNDRFSDTIEGEIAGLLKGLVE